MESEKISHEESLEIHRQTEENLRIMTVSVAQILGVTRERDFPEKSEEEFCAFFAELCAGETIIKLVRVEDEEEEEEEEEEEDDDEEEEGQVDRKDTADDGVEEQDSDASDDDDDDDDDDLDLDKVEESLSAEDVGLLMDERVAGSSGDDFFATMGLAVPEELPRTFTCPGLRAAGTAAEAIGASELEDW